MEKTFLTLTPGGGFKSGRSRRSGRVFRWLFSLLVLGLAIAFAEGLARFALARWGGPLAKRVVLDWNRAAEGAPQLYVPAPFVHYRLDPHYVAGGGGMRINAQGFRDDFDYDLKTSDTLRIVCLGGSTTFGTGVRDNRDAYPAALGRILDATSRPPGISRVEVFNMGVGGYTSAEVLANLNHSALPLRPDVALIEIAINDVNPRFYDGFDASYESFRKPMQAIEPGMIGGLLDQSTLYILSSWKLGWIPALTLQERTQHPLPPAERALANLKRNGTECFRANLRACIDLAQSNGIQAWLATEAYNEDSRFLPADDEGRALEEGYRFGLAQHNEVIRTLCEERGIGLIDLDRLLPRDIGFFVDPIHLNREGYAIQAEMMKQILERRLPSPAAQERAAIDRVSPKVDGQTAVAKESGAPANATATSPTTAIRKDEAAMEER